MCLIRPPGDVECEDGHRGAVLLSDQARLAVDGPLQEGHGAVGLAGEPGPGAGDLLRALDRPQEHCREAAAIASAGFQEADVRPVTSATSSKVQLKT